MSSSVVVSFKVGIPTSEIMYHYWDGYYEVKCSFSRQFISNCYERNLVDFSIYYFMVLFIPFFEFICYPLIMCVFSSYLAAFTIVKTYVVGLFFLVLCNASFLVVEITGYAYTVKGNRWQNGTISVPCILFANSSSLLEGQVLNISYAWLTIPKLFYGVSLYILLTSTVKFICAQCPYSMKGFLSGVMYGMCCLFLYIASFLRVLFFMIFEEDVFTEASMGCGVWYFAVAMILNALLILFPCGVLCRYSWRRRDENVHNEHIFAENYYSHYTTLRNCTS